MRKSILLAIGALIALIAFGLVVRSLFFQAEEPVNGPGGGQEIGDAGPTDTVAALEDETQNAVLVTVNGRVMRKEGDELVEVRVGDQLPADTTLETEEGSAVFRFAGTDGTVALEPQSAVTLTEEEGVAGVRLDRGRTVASSQRGVRVTFEGSDAVAESDDGQIAAVSDGAGRVTVQSERGTVRVSARGETVELDEGQESAVLPNSAPSAARAVPSSFFLRVRRPPGESRLAAATIRGEATPGSLVSVDGTPTTVDQNGRFRTRVALQQGRNQVVVTGRDASGRSQTSSHTVVVDSTASGISSDVSWD